MPKLRFEIVVLRGALLAGSTVCLALSMNEQATPLLLPDGNVSLGRSQGRSDPLTLNIFSSLSLVLSRR